MASAGGGRGGAGEREEPVGDAQAAAPPVASTSGAVAAAEQRERQLAELRGRELEQRAEAARASPSLAGHKLCIAAFNGNLSAARDLLDTGACVNYTNEEGATPLLCAVFRPVDLNMASFLLQRGADANGVDGLGYSALHWAARNDPTGRGVELLLGAGGHVNARNEDGVTPLHWAARRANEAAVRALLAAGAGKDLKAWGGVWEGKTPADIAHGMIAPDVQELLRAPEAVLDATRSE